MISVLINLICAAIWAFSFYTRYTDVRMQIYSPKLRIFGLVLDAYLVIYFIFRALFTSTFSPVLLTLAIMDLIVLFIPRFL